MEETQRIVRDLSFNDLRFILNSFEKSANGRTRVLRSRVSRLVVTNAVNEDNVSIFDVLREINSRAILNTMEITTQPVSIRSKQAILKKPTRSSSNLDIMEISRTPVHPDVRFRPLPFYEVLDELYKPTALKSNRASDVNTMIFHLTPIQVSALKNARNRSTYNVQVQVRIGLLETTSPQEDNFPPGLIVRVNGIDINAIQQAAPSTSSTNVRGTPINATGSIFFDPSVSNKVQVTFIPYFQPYVAAVYLVKYCSSEELLRKLRGKGLRIALYTQGMIQQKLSVDADSEIATTHLRVHLVCPLGKMRMTNPCRAITCDHVQCFDASIYLQLNEKSSKWMCPVCCKPAYYENLAIDGYFVRVLKSNRLPSSCTEIQLTSEGGWVPVGETFNLPVKPITSSSFHVDSSGDDCEVLEERAPVPVPVRRPRSPIFETVDLISSPSSAASSPSSVESRSYCLPLKKRKNKKSPRRNQQTEVITLSSDMDSDSTDSRSVTTQSSSSDSDMPVQWYRNLRRKQNLRPTSQSESIIPKRRMKRNRPMVMSSGSDHDSTQKVTTYYNINQEKSSPLMLVFNKQPSGDEETKTPPLNSSTEETATSQQIALSVLQSIISDVVNKSKTVACKSFDGSSDSVSESGSNAEYRTESSSDSEKPAIKKPRVLPPTLTCRPSILQRARPSEPPPQPPVKPQPVEPERSKRKKISEIVSYLLPKEHPSEPLYGSPVSNYCHYTPNVSSPPHLSDSFNRPNNRDIHLPYWSERFSPSMINDLDSMSNSSLLDNYLPMSYGLDLAPPNREPPNLIRRNTHFVSSTIASTLLTMPTVSAAESVSTAFTASTPGPSLRSDPSISHLPAILRKSRERR